MDQFNDTEIMALEIQQDTTKNNKVKYLFDELGGKANDTNFDNSSILDYALKNIIHNGGCIQFGSGVYEFKTPVYVLKRVKSIKLLGVAVGDGNNNGTTLNWSGQGYFLTFVGNLWWCTFESFMIACKNNDAIDFKGVLYHTVLREIYFKDAIRSIRIAGFAYAYLEHVFIHNSNADTIYGICIGCTQGTVKEFLYLNNCTFDGQSKVNADAVKIESGSHIYMSNCDICNWGAGMGCSITKEYANEMLALIYISNCNIIRCKGGLTIYAKASSIGAIFIDCLSLIFEGGSVDEKGIFITSSDKATSQVVVKNYHTRKIRSISPDYVLFASENSLIDTSSFEISQNLAKGKININDKKGNINLSYNSINKAGEHREVLSGNKNVLKIDITSESPYSYLPKLIVTNNLGIPFKYDLENTNGGKLTLKVEFEKNPIGLCILNYFIIN